MERGHGFEIPAINIRPSAGSNRFTRSGRVYREYYTKFMVSVARELARNVRRIELGGISVAAFAIDHPEEDLSRARIDYGVPRTRGMVCAEKEI